MFLPVVHHDLHYSPASAAYRQPTMACSTKVSVPVQHVLQPYRRVKMLRANHVLTISFQASSNSESYVGFKQFNQLRLGKDATSGINVKKCVPVGSTEVPYAESRSTTTEVQYVESSEVGVEYVQKLTDIQQLIIGLQMTTDPLNAAYKLQLVSEGFELVIGCPIAEFERFLQFAAPVIDSS